MTLDRSLSLVTAILLTIILGLGGYIVVDGTRQQLEAAKADEMQATALLLTSSMAQSASLSATHADRIAKDPLVLNLMKQGDRDGLTSLLKPTYDALASEAGVNMLHFHTSDIKSFLRVQDPKNFGQDLSTIRPMILAANRSHILQKGLEVGLAGLSLRAVAPMLEGETLVGTVEVGVDLKALLEIAKSASGADYALFLSPAMTGITPKDSTVKAEGAGLAIESATDTALFQKLYDRRAIGLSREPTSAMVELDDHRYGTFAQPLLDYSGRMIGTIFIVRDFSTIESGFLRSIAMAAIIAAVGGIFVFSIVTVVLRAVLIRPLADLVDHAETLASGKIEGVSSESSGHGDLRRLRDAIDRLSAGNMGADSKAHHGDAP
ncbi:hypothetical protein G6N76_07975 [Rhizobium daejeonense]|uniref:Double Cache domain-containing protein n=1 Tax=Rhizobium daejeonense TaxID=240521 RepID=A0A6M1S363_9HYPH|nr:cache domain-containing protein [Rhizobium daejeonense]NGO63610.1 hypothetical protein [Rhizobium daejeonense]